METTHVQEVVVWIPAPFTGVTWKFSTLICCKNCIVCLKRPNIKEVMVGPLFKKYIFFHAGYFYPTRVFLVILVHHAKICLYHYLPFHIQNKIFSSMWWNWALNGVTMYWCEHLQLYSALWTVAKSHFTVHFIWFVADVLARPFLLLLRRNVHHQCDQ